MSFRGRGGGRGGGGRGFGGGRGRGGGRFQVCQKLLTFNFLAIKTLKSFSFFSGYGTS